MTIDVARLAADLLTAQADEQRARIAMDEHRKHVLVPEQLIADALAKAYTRATIRTSTLRERIRAARTEAPA